MLFKRSFEEFDDICNKNEYKDHTECERVIYAIDDRINFPPICQSDDNDRTGILFYRIYRSTYCFFCISSNVPSQYTLIIYKNNIKTFAICFQFLFHLSFNLSHKKHTHTHVRTFVEINSCIKMKCTHMVHIISTHICTQHKNIIHVGRQVFPREYQVFPRGGREKRSSRNSRCASTRDPVLLLPFPPTLSLSLSPFSPLLFLLFSSTITATRCSCSPWRKCE